MYIPTLDSGSESIVTATTRPLAPLRVAYYTAIIDNKRGRLYDNHRFNVWIIAFLNPRLCSFIILVIIITRVIWKGVYDKKIVWE